MRPALSFCPSIEHAPCQGRSQTQLAGAEAVSGNERSRPRLPVEPWLQWLEAGLQNGTEGPGFVIPAPPFCATLIACHPSYAESPRVVWWDTPEQVLSRLDDFLARVMTLGSFADANTVERIYGIEVLRAALRSASPGIFDIRSWHYWHHRLGLGDAGPLPTRRLE
jgi:hypothetical protein